MSHTNDDDLPFAEEIVDEAIPMGEKFTHNEQFFVDGGVLTMASSNVEEIWYGCPGCENNDSQEVLYVRFKNGGIYKYFDVPLGVVIKFVETASPGRFVWNELRGVYSYQKIGMTAPRPKPNVVRKIN
jgi:hypothetical protein